MCICEYIHICVYVDIYMYVYMWIYTHVYVNIHIRVYVNIYTHVYVNIYTHTCICKYTHTADLHCCLAETAHHYKAIIFQLKKKPEHIPTVICSRLWKIQKEGKKKHIMERHHHPTLWRLRSRQTVVWQKACLGQGWQWSPQDVSWAWFFSSVKLWDATSKSITGSCSEFSAPVSPELSPVLMNTSRMPLFQTEQTGLPFISHSIAVSSTRVSSLPIC